jgi:hypothetical protein
VERVFAPGASIAYGCDVFGAALSRDEGRSLLEAQIFLGGGTKWFNFFDSGRLPVRPEYGPRMHITGKVSLPPDLVPGHYYLALRVLDEQRQPQQGAEELMGFEVVKPDAPPVAR